MQEFEKHKAKPETYSYYKDFLDKAFWTLSTAPGSSGGRLSGLPFLNGGLFDDDEFFQPSEVRKTNPPLKVRNRTFEFVFQELLEAFNFTVTEDTPLNQEVAVDPEMLGKVFESIVLHAEQADPDAVAPDKRKATGSYYTPRIVVHFICQEVLYQYLLNHLKGEGWGPRLRTLLATDTSDGLDEEEKGLLRKTITPEQGRQILDLVKPLKCCDPSVGSGAFPVGLLHELVSLRRVLETAVNGYVDPARGEGHTWLQKTKEDIVQNCLFGVDIQQQAIEICRLRLWLSLVVDYDLGLDPFGAEKGQYNRAIDGISQLPNLEMNFHRGDSLHDHISDVPVLILPDKASRYSEEFKKIARLGDELHRAKRGEKKRRLRVEILHARLGLSERIIKEELKALDTNESGLDTLFHDETSSSSDKRKRIKHEQEQLSEALTKIEKDRSELEKLANKQYDNQFYVKLRKLEGADFDSPINFVWYVDFPQIFIPQTIGVRGGFDIIVGNPPFVTARNPHKRELWRERWPRVSVGTYQLVCPFFELGFSLLAKGGQLGFIVSNAFAKREFGQALVEKFLTTIDLQKVVDCSGLLFPGHGTPTCLFFGSNKQPSANTTIRAVVTLPGGGDLRTAPEESPLWATIEGNHARTNGSPEQSPLSITESKSGFRVTWEDSRIAVGDCARDQLLKHPIRWTFPEWGVLEILDRHSASHLETFLAKPLGFNFDTHQDDVFKPPLHVARYLDIRWPYLRRCFPANSVRNWQVVDSEWLLSPYSANWELEKEGKGPIFSYLRRFKQSLSGRAVFDGGTYESAGRPWYEFHQLDLFKSKAPYPLICPEIATHVHVLLGENTSAWPRTVQVGVLANATESSQHLIAGLLNSAAVSFWLKQVCFNKGAGEDEEKDRFVYAGNKIQQLPIPHKIEEGLTGKSNGLADALVHLSGSCWHRGQRMPSLSLRKLFEHSEEAHGIWNGQLPGHASPDSALGLPFDSSSALSEAFQKARAVRDRVRGEMIALQEEMDWLVYAAYGFLSEQHPALKADFECEPLEREQRPFVLWEKAQEDYAKAASLVPNSWSDCRRKLWEARLATIRDNENIRRIEQPVYKRRWDEQWKVGNQWRSGPIAYAAEFMDAFESWLREKAEWWLENKKNGGPAEIEQWTNALWSDSRVQAAWHVAAEEYALLENEKAREKAVENGEPTPALAKPATDATGFRRKFKTIIDDETVPAGFPFAIPYKELEKKLKKKVPAKLQSIRGKLNVPRERFHRGEDDRYSWAGLQFRS